MKLRTILLGSCVAAFAFAGSSDAAHFHGWYVGVEGGANWVKDDNFKLTGNVGALESGEGGPAQLGKANFDTGWAAMATVGYAFTNNWRVELEGGYRHNKFKATVLDPGDFTETAGEATAFYRGHLNEFTIMANVLYDFQLTDRLSLSLGVGAGADNSKWKMGPLEDSSWNFAYQGIVGLSYALTHRLDLTLDFRYLRVPNVDYSPAFGPIGVHSDDYQKESVTVGLRYDLTADEEPMEASPPPMAPPPPPAAPAHFIIFFGFNKCNITSEADSVLSEAASAAKSMGSASVTIVGHTDTVGSNKYNQKLSECRAHAAASNLVGKGVPKGAISTSGRGETELMVQTGDGVKEPQNRRATIDLH